MFFAVICSVALVCCGVFSGCSKTDSVNIKTEGIYTVSSVTSDGTQTVCESTLKVGGYAGTFVELSEQDTLQCNGVPMTKKGSGNVVWSHAVVPTIPRSSYVIKFVRANDTSSAEVMLPTAISKLEILGGPNQKIGAPISAKWEATTDSNEKTTAVLSLKEMKEKTYSSTELASGTPDAGTVTFDSSQTVVRSYGTSTAPAADLPGPYEGKVEVQRTFSGTVSGLWKGMIEGKQKSSLPVELQ
jgi:hypothetical protein